MNITNINQQAVTRTRNVIKILIQVSKYTPHVYTHGIKLTWDKTPTQTFNVENVPNFHLRFIRI